MNHIKMAKTLKNKANKGFTLLEVLVAVVLITLSFLSMLMLQMHSMRYSTTAYYRGIASQIGTGLAASVRVNPDGLSNYSYKLSYAPTAEITGDSCTSGAYCSTKQIADADVKWARQSARAQLPGGDLYIAGSNAGSGYVDIVLIWLDPTSKDENMMPCSDTIAASTVDSTYETAQCMPMKVSL